MEMPRFELKVNAFHAGELSMLVTDLARQFSTPSLMAADTTIPFGGSGDMVADVRKASENIKVPSEVEAPKEKKAKKEKPVEETPKTEKTSEAVKPTYTKEDIADACQKVSGTKGLESAKAILSSFKGVDGKPCRRISDVQEADYSDFIAKCEKA